MKAREFWNESITQASWQKLQELSKEMSFTLIGGWAAWLWTKQHKSKDIDIIVDYKELEKIRQEYPLEKNDRLRKYEVKMQDFDIDIYLPHYSRLELPTEELLEEKVKIEGINTISCESLLILKQGAEIARRNSIKGRKDTIDIITLLLYAPISLEKYWKSLKEHGKESLKKELITEIQEFEGKESEQYLGISFQQFQKWKREIVEKIRKLR